MTVLELLILALVLLWVFGGIVSPVGTPAIHLLLVIVLVLVGVRLLQGRRL